MSLIDRYERTEARHLGYGLSEVGRGTRSAPSIEVGADELDGSIDVAVPPIKIDASPAQLSKLADELLRKEGFSVRTGLELKGKRSDEDDSDLDDSYAPSTSLIERQEGLGIDYEEALQIGLHVGTAVVSISPEASSSARHSSTINGVLKANNGDIRAFEGLGVVD